MNLSSSSFSSPPGRDNFGWDAAPGRSPEKVQVIAVGSVPAVEEFVMRMYHIRFARPYEWTPAQPSPSNPDHIMRTVIKPIHTSST